MFKQDCDIFTFFTLLLYIIKGGVYSNDHLNISHPMHGGGGLTSIDPDMLQYCHSRVLSNIGATYPRKVCKFVL